MDSQLLYQQDPLKFEFDADVVEFLTLPDGRRGVLLDQSYFYPTGGGQEHDCGQIDKARVVDVYRDEGNSRLVHVVEGEVGSGRVHAVIDATRRLRHMQHHTGQHLLTQCILRVTGFETVSANINGYSASTLDVVAPQLTKSDLDQAETLANGIIYENRAVKTYIVTPDQLKSIPLRRPPKVTENIRIVEIDGFDFSPCGGTHVAQTGSIGLLKVLKAEKQNDKQRIYFMAGLQALQVFHEMFATFTGLANQLSTAWQDLPNLMGKQAEQLAALQKELQGLRQSVLKYEASTLAASAADQAGIKLVQARFENRPVSELRQLGEELRKLPGVVAFLAAYDGQKLSLVVTCGDGSGKDARQLLTHQLASINGRGGGDARLAQGGGLVSLEQFKLFLEQVDL